MGVAQLAEHRTVAPDVVGSIPISHPSFIRINSPFGPVSVQSAVQPPENWPCAVRFSIELYQPSEPPVAEPIASLVMAAALISLSRVFFPLVASPVPSSESRAAEPYRRVGAVLGR